MAPFKSQNMALNSFITRDGLEMGRAQVVQAQAAGIEPDVRMNPILLKPSSDIGSQVIVNGEVAGPDDGGGLFPPQKDSCIPDILAAYDSLAEEYGHHRHRGRRQPGGDQPQGGRHRQHGAWPSWWMPPSCWQAISTGAACSPSFTALWSCWSRRSGPAFRALIINKFRGDVEILRPGLTMLEEQTRLPVLGVVPYLNVDIEDEDSLSQRLDVKNVVKPLDVAIIRLPRLSNFTDFISLEQHPLLGVRYVESTRGARRAGPASFCRAPRTPWTTCSGSVRPGWKRPF